MVLDVAIKESVDSCMKHLVVEMGKSVLNADANFSIPHKQQTQEKNQIDPRTKNRINPNPKKQIDPRTKNRIKQYWVD
jgi:hypothetical protein